MFYGSFRKLVDPPGLAVIDIVPCPDGTRMITRISVPLAHRRRALRGDEQEATRGMVRSPRFPEN